MISKTLGSLLQVLNTLPLLNGIVVVPGLARFLCIQVWIPKLQITGIISEKKKYWEKTGSIISQKLPETQKKFFQQ